MTLHDLDTLRKDNEQDGLYNFFEPTFRSRSLYQESAYIIPVEGVMRPDLFSNEIYNKPNLLDFLLNYNDIDNPLNLMEGDVVFYVAFGSIDDFKLKEIDKDQTRKKLLNTNKSSKIDKNRQKYVEDNFALPPNISPIPRSPITFEGDNLVIGT